MLARLTPQQEALMPVVKDHWINLALKGQYDPARIESGMAFVYSLFNAPPPKVIHCKSPIGARMTILALRQLEGVPDGVRAGVRAGVWDGVWDGVNAGVRAGVRAGVSAGVWAGVRAGVWDGVRDGVSAGVRAGVRAGVSAGVRDGVWDGVSAGVSAGVRAGVRAGVSAGVWDGVRDGELENITPDGYCNWSDWPWTAYYDYFRQIFEVPCGWENFSKWVQFLEGNPYETYSYEDMTFVVHPPTTIIKNEAGRLHNPTGPAVVFPDGFSLYFINGRNLPAWIWEKQDTITREMFLTERNAEIRGGMYAVLGQKRVFDLIGAEEIARRHANNETYILYRTAEKIGEKHWQWVGVTCPSTATDYLLGVPDTVTDPIEAVAGTWGLSASEYIIDQHT